MRTLFPAITFTLLALGARASNADKATVVVDCKTQITSSSVGGIGIRVVTGGAISGMQAYVHALPSTNSKTKEPTLVGAVNVKYGMKPMNNTVAMNIVGEDAATKFQLVVKKAKTAGGDNTASFEKTELGTTKLETQDMVCTVASTEPVACDAAAKPAACPGGGAVACTDGQWKCAELPHGGCDAAKKPAACPGGGAVACTDGQWKCGELPKACDAATKPAACPGGGAAACTAGQWKCAPLPHK